MKTITVEESIKICLDKNLTFAAYRLPNESDTEIVIQAGNKIKIFETLSDFNKLKGFLVVPFALGGNSPSFLIKPDLYITKSFSKAEMEKLYSLQQQPILSDSTHTPEEVSHDEYIAQLALIINKVHQGIFEKVVPSRTKIIRGSFVSDMTEIFSKLCHSNPNDFVYIFNAGPHLWIGATPEPLLKSQNGTMHTVSLAGTRALTERNLNIGAWNSKERLEQEYVTRYINKVLSKFNLKNIVQEGPYTKKSGNLVHLRTDFSFSSKEIKNNLGVFLNELHPTPAVCGMPRKDSLELLKNIEKHQREYYSGFLGPVGLKDTLSLFVNLRCMKVLEESLALFVGGGITADSIPEDEWLETEIKAETLLSVIQQIKT